MRGYNHLQLVDPLEILHQTSEISITGNYNCLVIVIKLDHSLQNKFSVAIAFSVSVVVRDRRLEYEIIPCATEVIVQSLMLLHIPDEIISLCDSVLILEKDSESFVIDFPSRVFSTEMQIVSINESVVFHVIVSLSPVNKIAQLKPNKVDLSVKFSGAVTLCNVMRYSDCQGM